MTRPLRILALALCLGACSPTAGQGAFNTGNAIVKAARAVCRYVNLLPDAPFPTAPDAGSSGGAADAQ